MSLINCTPIKITYTRTHCCAEKGKEGEEGWQEVRRGAAAGRGTVCFLNLGNVLAALTIISCEPLAGRLWQKRLVAVAAAAQGRRRGHGGAKGRDWLVLLFKQACANLFKNYKSARTRAERAHTHALYIHVCVYIYSRSGWMQMRVAYKSHLD